MIICPNCNHQNPEGSIQCENCYTTLPSSYNCPNCGASVQQDATFCGQCGFNLQAIDTELITADNLFDHDMEEDLTPTVAVNSNFEQSPWDLEEDLSSAEPEPLFVEEETELTPAASSSTTEIEELEELSGFEPEPLFVEEETELTPAASSSTAEIEELEELSGFEPEPLFVEEETELTPAASSSTAEIEELEELSGFESEPLFVEEETELTPAASSSTTEIEELEELSGFESEPLFVEEAETISSSSTVDSTEQVEELEDSLKETEDIDSWISSVKEESALEEDAVNEISELSDSEEIFVPESTVSEVDTLEFVPASTEPIEAAVLTTGAVSSASVIDEETTTEQLKAVLFHIQTGTKIEIAPNLTTIRIGKPNSQNLPDIDVSGFPNSEIVSRIHAHIIVEDNTYLIEDRGSSNGTYINRVALPAGSRHLLRDSDRICLGKGDLVTFIFHLV